MVDDRQARTRGRYGQNTKGGLKVANVFLGLLLVFAFFLTVNDYLGLGILPTWQRIFEALGQEEEVALTLPEGVSAVHVIDIGQGDAVLLQQGGAFALIDTGEAEMSNVLIAYLKSQGVETLEYLIVTHMHSDHMGGAGSVLANFNVKKVLLPNGALSPKPEYYGCAALLNTIKKGGYDNETPAIGAVYPLGVGTIEIVSAGIASDGQNNASLAVYYMVTSEDVFSYLATADGEKPYEKDLLQNGYMRRALIFKAGHHGSYTSNGSALLEAAMPAYVAISCGANNAYGYPHTTPLANFEAVGAEVLRTDLNGTIVFLLGENGIEVKCEKTAA